eukprot:8760771-Lingulodinium_polyedra.AAC.1
MATEGRGDGRLGPRGWEERLHPGAWRGGARPLQPPRGGWPPRPRAARAAQWRASNVVARAE